MAVSRGDRQERSRERRDQLLRATIDLIAERGMKAVTHRAVSAAAGLPSAAAGYYFATIAELIEQALDYHVRQRVAQLTAVLGAATEGLTEPGPIADAVARALITSATRDGLAQYEVYLEAARNPELRASVARSMAAFEEVAAARLAALGARDPGHAAKAFVALADGFALHRLAFPQSFDTDLRLLREGLRGLFLSYTTDES